MNEELMHELVKLVYSPEIVSFELSREQGLEILKEIERLNKRVKECEEAYLRTRHQYSELENKYLTDEYVINELEKIIINEEKEFSKPVYISSQTLLNKIKKLKGDSDKE